MELTRVLAYPKFRLDSEDRRHLLAEYLLHCEVVELAAACEIQCRDAKDQPFLDLAQSGNAEFLISGDKDLLELEGRASFLIATAAAYRRVISANG